MTLIQKLGRVVCGAQRGVVQNSGVFQQFAPVLSTHRLGGWNVRSFSAAVKLDVSMVKKLRDMTGAPMMDCKKALTEASQQTETDTVEFAVDWLRKKGKAAVAKKAGRTATEGLVGVVVNEGSSRGAVVELNSETDFVARNEMFHALLFDMLNASLQHEQPSKQDVLATKSTVQTGSVEDHFTAVITALRENIQFRRVETLDASTSGRVAAYAHAATTSQGTAKLGRIGCLVNLEPKEGEVTSEDLVSFGGKVAMHVAAGFPQYLDASCVPESAVKREMDLLTEQAGAEGGNKPAHIIEKMMAGRMNKFYEDKCLLNQKFLISSDGSKQPAVQQVLDSHNLRVTGFSRFECGQEIEGEETSEAAN